VAAQVTDFGAGLRALADDLVDTLRAAPAIGITAPHIGVAKRVVVLQLPGTDGPRVYVNPAIVWASEERQRHQEGSVSMPGVTEEVERHARVGVEYQDLAGEKQSEEADGFLAVCHQHEIDQLDGIIWTRRLSQLRRDRLFKRFHRLQKNA
jgi:peptide deformylase